MLGTEGEESTAAFADANGKERSTSQSRCLLKKKAEDAGLGNADIKGHFLRIGVRPQTQFPKKMNIKLMWRVLWACGHQVTSGST